MIYYDCLSDLFAIVDSKSNKLLEYSIASKIDYADIFRYKSVFQDKTAAQLTECSDEKLNPFEISCPVEEKQLIPFKVKLNDFDQAVKKKLPANYNPVDGWWLDRQKEIISSLNLARFAQLSIELKPTGPIKDPITEIEALTILQAEEENLVTGSFRPDMINSEKERKLNFDFKILSWNKLIFIGLTPKYADVKSPLDPEVIRARNEPEQTLEDQVDNLLKTISLQRQRAIKNNESVIHIITLLRIKPSDRAYFIDNFKQKALRQNLDLNGIKFINTSSNII